jgi:predicted PurR-regulated permease PerM
MGRKRVTQGAPAEGSDSSYAPAKRFLSLLLVGCGVVLIMVMRPLWQGLFLAMVLASVLHPAHLWLSHKMRNSPTLAAGVLVVAVVLVTGAVATVFSVFVVKEGREGVEFVSQTVKSSGVEGLWAKMPEPVQRFTHRVAQWVRPEGDSAAGDDGETEVHAAVQKQLSEQGGRAATALGAVMSTAGSLLFQFMVMVIALFFFIRDGSALLTWADGASLLKPGQTRELISGVTEMSTSVVISTAITSSVQASAALVGYFIGRVPHPFFFAAVTFVMAFVPAVGAGSVCVLAAALLLATGHGGSAIFLALWGLLVVGLVDNLIKPWLIRRRVQFNAGAVFFALIGGVAAFGAVGLLVGPLGLALFLSLVRMHRRDFRSASTAPTL